MNLHKLGFMGGNWYFQTTFVEAFHIKYGSAEWQMGYMENSTYDLLQTNVNVLKRPA
jgi:hypothetical protein